MTEIHIRAGTNYADAIKVMVLEALPAHTFHIKPVSQYTKCTLMFGTLRDSNPWLDAEELAASIGMRLRRRGNTVTAYTPLAQHLVNLRWRLISDPIRRARWRINEKLNPPVEYPDPDYGDWSDD